MGLLLLVLSILVAVGAFVLLLLAFAKRWRGLAIAVTAAAGLWLIAYSSALLVVSLSSEDVELGVGEAKSYCGAYLDCHMHTALEAVRKTKSIEGRQAEGQFYVATVKVFSDAKKARLGLHGVDAHVIADGNQVFERDFETEYLLGRQPEFETRILPSEAFSRKIVFDLPEDVERPLLVIREGGVLTTLLEGVLIGDEDSFFHGRKRFALSADSNSRVHNGDRR